MRHTIGLIENKNVLWGVCVEVIYVSNEELYEKIKDLICDDLLEETIVNMQVNNKKEFDIVNNKIDDVCFVLKDLVKVLNELV